MAYPSVALARPARRRHTLLHEIIRNRWAYLFISPFFILFLIFQAFPVAYSIYISLHDWRGLGPMDYVGLENYKFLLGAGAEPFASR